MDVTPEAFYQYLIGRGFERRKSQEEMIKIVNDLLEEGGVKLVEAPTGTGKTFAYLIPLIVKGKKAIISTGTKILQDQLRRDIEFLLAHWRALTGKELNYAVLKGKGNYLCLDRFVREEISPEERLEVETLLDSSWDGDLTLLNISEESFRKINVDEDYCTYAYRSVCPHYDRCLYWKRARERERKADILVVNHSLLALKEMDTHGRFLVIDEAHELDRYLTLATTFSLSLYWFEDLKKSLEKALGKEVELRAEEFFASFKELFSEEEREVPLESLEEVIPRMRELLYKPLKRYIGEFEELVKKEVRGFLQERLMVSYAFKDFLLNSFLFSEEEISGAKGGYEELTEEEKELLSRVKKLEYFRRKLTRLKLFMRAAEEGEEVGFKVSRSWSRKLSGYNYRLEIFRIFPRDILEVEEYEGVLLTSATVDPEDLYLTTGVEGEYYRLPYNFDYSRSEFIVENTNPKREEWKDKLMTSFWVLRSRYERVLVLLTNREHLKLFRDESEAGIQGEGSLSSLINSMREGKIKVLVGLDSLWTGVDVPGEKGILMAKLPFENPRDPLTYHRIRYLRSIGEDPFLYQRKKAFIKFRQGVGRLVRKRDDGGSIVLCDNRIWRYPEFVEFVRELGMKVIYRGKNRPGTRVRNPWW